MTETPASTPLECPNCGTAIPSGQQYCPACGVDVILYTDQLFRQRLEEALSPAPVAPSSVEELIPRLGDSLVAQKLITPVQLQNALAEQVRRNAEGKGTKRLGQIIVSMGILQSDQLDRAVARMVKELQNALQVSNRNLEERVQERTAELSRALERLSELNQLKANFIANISHELRTPMTHIIGYLDLLTDDTFGSLSSQQREAMDTIQRAAQRLHELIEDLIQFSDTSTAGISLNLQPLDLRSTLQEVLAKLMARAQNAGLQVVVGLPPEQPPVQADQRKINWVLLQLLDNGIKFTPPGGTVTVRAGLAGERLWVSVTDTGIGIPSARMEELFQPFHQLDGSASRRRGGTGMGLSLCRQIIEAHGSKLTVQSKEGKGSTFLFDLPVTPAQQADQPKTTPRPIPRGTG
jgi:signal transduction histidine kinase